MRERTGIQRQKATSNSSSIPSLRQPTRGFGSGTSQSAPQAHTEGQIQAKPLSHDISRISLLPQTKIQTKLTVNQPGDIFEQEADNFADNLNQSTSIQQEQLPANSNTPEVQREELDEEEMQMKPLANSDTPEVQREELDEEEMQMKPLANSDTPEVQREELDEEEMQMKPLANSDFPQVQREALEEEEEEMQMKSLEGSYASQPQREALPTQKQTSSSLQRSGDGGLVAGENVESQINSTKSNGSPLPTPVRSVIEPQLGYDLSDIKVHTDSTAVQLNKDLQSQAFTHQNHIYYGQGKSPSDMKLTAHELVHTQQQKQGMKLVQNEQ
ncbi:MAG: DUF4157 domain-containing protein [Desmonostoc vinosum HA7617-LM4]|jgi:flagellar basal body rod protein FlgB|nr:DUF4157 domain-containing protein [Desmonostoc vinosum HA7617-LM4]